LSEEVVAERAAFFEEQPALSEHKLVFLDESAISTNLHHAYGRAPAGQRVTLYAPTYGARRTLVGAISTDGRTALAVLDDGLRISSFQDFIRDHLAPMLHPGDVVIMDNLRVHKNPDAVAAIQATGATVVFQPRYSPEFNAIEHCWSWLKHHLRSLGCRAIDPLVSYAEQLWRKITPELCQSWAKGCGYAV
jgi:transposase